MAKNEPNKPEEVKTAPALEATADEKSTPAPMPEIGGEVSAPEKTAEETAALPHEDGAALHETAKDRPEIPTPIDIPAPGDVVVPFDKINEIISGKQAAVKEAEQTAPEKQESEKSVPDEKKKEPEKPAPDKRTENEPKTADSKPKSRSQKTTEKVDEKPSRPAKQEKAKTVKPEKPDKPKQAAEIGGASSSPQAAEPAKQETPPQPRNCRPNRRKHPAPANRNRLFILIFPSFSRSKTTRFKSAMMKKWRLWWKALRTRALPSLPLCAPAKMAAMKSYPATAARKPAN